MKKVSLDLHDFSILNNRMDLLFQLKEFFPNFKVSMFTIPWDYRQEKNSSQRVYRDEALKKDQGEPRLDTDHSSWTHSLGKRDEGL